MKKVSKLVLLTTSLLVLGSCGNKPQENPPKEPDTPSVPNTPEGNEDVTTPSEFDGIVFGDTTITYDGNEHTIVAKNVVDGALVTYENAGPFKDAGEYNIKVKVTKEGYKDFTKSAKLTIKKARISGVSLSEDTKTITYDRLNHKDIIKLNGTLPEGVTSTCTITKGGTTVSEVVNAGTYTFTYKCVGKNYEDLILTATVNVKKGTFDTSSYEYKNVTVEYDATDHIHDVQFVGILPETATTTEVVTKNDVEVTEAIDAGVYKYKLTIEDPNYETAVFEATLRINAKEEKLGITQVGTKIYFANSLHNKYLYSYDTSDTAETKLEHVSNDVVEEFEVSPSGKERAFISKAGLLSSVKTISSSGEIDTIFSENISELEYADTDDTFIYAKNGLTSDSSNTYELSFDADKNPVSTLLIDQMKCKNICHVDNGTYFTIKNRLYFYDDVTVVNVLDEDQKEVKITEIAAYGNKVVINRNELLGDYIQTVEYKDNKFVFKKITKDAGKYFNVVGDTLYFSNIDKLNSTLFGAGVYKVKLNSITTDFVSEKIIPAESLISNLYVNGNDIYYFHVETKSLHHVDMTQDPIASENLLEGFVAPEPITTSLIKGKNIEYKGKIYYTNVYDNKALYRYDPLTNKSVKITSNKVKDFIIADDTIYYNEVTWGVNNDLYALKLAENSTPIKLSTDDCVELVKHGNYLYYTKLDALGNKVEFDRIVLDTPDHKVEIVNKTPFSNVRIYGDYLYGIKNNSTFDEVVRLDLTKEDNLNIFVESNNFNPNLNRTKYFEIVRPDDKTVDMVFSVRNDKLYYSTLTQKENPEIKLGVKIDSIYTNNNKELYFVTKEGKICRLHMNGDGGFDVLYEPAIVGGSLTKHPEIIPSELTFYDGYIYFNSNQDNSYHFYRIDISKTSANQVIEQLD